MGGDQLPSMIEYYVDQHANGGYDGACAIRDAVQAELEQTYFADALQASFGVTSWALSVYEAITGSDKHYMWASGWKNRYNGYNIMYIFATDGPGTYSDSDCRDGDAKSMATCLHGKYNDCPWVLYD